MRIALIGIFGAKIDEGMRKLCVQIEAAAGSGHEVLTVQTGDFCRGRAWSALRQFRPDCLHYLTGPTVFSLLALKFHRLTLPGRVTTVATGIRPYLSGTGRALLPALAPDHYLAQSRRWARLFAEAGSQCRDFPNGVDTRRFRPVTQERRAELKARWGLPADRPVVLHVGHVKENRNLDSLLEVQRSGRYQVWIVGSESESEPGPWRTRLEEAGCRIFTQYVPAIEEVYQAADRYVFTVRALPADRFPRHYQEIGVIDLPLSILEAMACGLPVLSTRHDAVAHFCGDVKGLGFFDGSAADCLRQLDVLPTAQLATRAAAERLDLERVMGGLGDFYAELAPTAGRTGAR